ncbi:hypothetical protein Cpap_0909 [Ruminiclostridium papyrosolvens DSM 2782]|uniref:Uncharacterized protein n=1 Tax=Ruminiclostridium papyrosolvens DSM 2782 TaxID=588581 RepID=F1TH56_9FIRM|nr:hypothetical protein [Ruminiclostridium papyrosolvens]EGD46296.1 hypothetical protein Cpap_0909 [Ruminiclostridium papyrosolvens DSM 2782]WES32983.1 hypothetical protein P0092_14600 [Ruminiclostridium papyrosolvens DSM 2782]
MSENIRENLLGIVSAFCFESGRIKECILCKKNVIKTEYGDLIPKYGEDEVRKKYCHSISFYESGKVKSISLESSTLIKTTLGTFPAELVTFYESGSLKRIFPLNGKLSGYWGQEDEEKLCDEFRFHFPFGSFKTKIIGLCFYESGNLKSLTLWPGENIILKAAHDLIPVRIGFSLYENGKLKSVEPAYEITVPTLIGELTAYDANALGIHADCNSLVFTESGNIQALSTSSSKVAIFEKGGSFETMKAIVKPDPFEEGVVSLVPLEISFEGHYVKFNSDKKRIYDINTTRFTIVNDSAAATGSGLSCTDCSSCSLCKKSNYI